MNFESWISELKARELNIRWGQRLQLIVSKYQALLFYIRLGFLMSHNVMAPKVWGSCWVSFLRLLNWESPSEFQILKSPQIQIFEFRLFKNKIISKISGCEHKKLFYVHQWICKKFQSAVFVSYIKLIKVIFNASLFNISHQCHGLPMIMIFVLHFLTINTRFLVLLIIKNREFDLKSIRACFVNFGQLLLTTNRRCFRK